MTIRSADIADHAQNSQSELTALLSREASAATPLFSKHEPFWISNQVYFQDATFELVEKLVGLSSIAEVREEKRLQRWKPVKSALSADVANNSTRRLAGTPEWGVRKIQAPEYADIKRILTTTVDTATLNDHAALAAIFDVVKAAYRPDPPSFDAWKIHNAQ
ncbi:hypothetical protein PybrP1_009692 [[Pythium] brassicae (nom. inval.)]|nr:hypothetical protein PybrP1_009692 [[Pythium] brassicae (nom. inval.)]